MKTLFYINGKNVSFEKYSAAVNASTYQQETIKACVKYCKSNPQEFENILKLSGIIPDEEMGTFLMQHWENTPEGKAMCSKLLEDAKKPANPLGCLIVIFVVSVIVLILYMANN